jgi:hypothetical protein
VTSSTCFLTAPKGDLQEALVTLYLRLNGYFTTGFIVQSSRPGRVTTELDVLAIRFPNNSEPERIIGGAPELDRWAGGIDFIIGEVKSYGDPLQFNAAVRCDAAVMSILRWWGHLTEEEIIQKREDVLRILQPLPNTTAAPEVPCPRGARVRTILFSPETRNRRPEQAWFITGPQIFRYVFDCLHPPQPRDTCATNYGAGQWGTGLGPLVGYFKEPGRTAPGDLNDLLTHLGVNAA